MRKSSSSENGTGTTLEQSDFSTVADYLEILQVDDFVSAEEDDSELWSRFASLIQRYKNGEEE